MKVSANDLHLTIANLESWTKYDVKIFAMNDLYQSDSVSLKDVDVSGKRKSQCAFFCNKGFSQRYSI